MDRTHDPDVPGLERMRQTSSYFAQQSPTTQKLMRAFLHMSHAEWHERSVAGCTNSEIRVLMCLRHRANPEAQEMTVSQISKQLHVTSPAITQLLKGLEAKSLVERLSDASDKRTVPFHLTEQGIFVAHKAFCTFAESIQGLIAFLGEEQSEQLANLLTKMFYYFSERAVIANDPYLKGESQV